MNNHNPAARQLTKSLLTPDEEKLLAEMNPTTAAKVRPWMELSRQTLNDLQERIDDLKVNTENPFMYECSGCSFVTIERKAWSKHQQDTNHERDFHED